MSTHVRRERFFFMPTISVPLAERSYSIEIESGILRRITDFPFPDEIAVLSNDLVAPLYADALCERLRASGKRVLSFNAPEGETSKSVEWLARAWDALAEGGLRRGGCVIAVGGGVVGDWAGFVAATWMRGVEFVQIPTTLLAMVDSSVGGKTGINHARAKNLIGAFHQPSRVLIDPDCLRTLPAREMSAGLAEVIKYGVIADAEFFNWLERNLDKALGLNSDALQHIIARSCEIKAQVVGEDERESDASGRRATLNYGHTVGHAIEATTHYGELLHGEAIAIGMTVAARLAIEIGTLAPDAGRELLERQTQLFERAKLPTQVPDECEFERLWAAMALDKKARGGAVNFVLPRRIGEVMRVENVSAEQVKNALHT